MQLEREKRIRETLQCANAVLDSSIKSKLKAMEELYKEDPVKYNIHIQVVEDEGFEPPTLTV